ncbi:phage tail tube protein [Corynebacterium glyciniphilum]|uniref:phage tail tube protein n=1 Tax=Corynebacterium glyciniphilum TaxID=1404244 RepID=UPI003FD1E852
MALGDNKNVLVGIPDVSGGLWVSDLVSETSALPTASTELAESFTAVGFISEDGITEANERDTDKVKAWGGDTVRILQNEHTITYSFTFLEMGNPEVLKLLFGEDNIETSGGVTTIKKNAKVLEHKTFVIEVLDGDKKIRLVVPDGQITETGERQFSHNAVLQVEVTIEAFSDADGNKGYEYHTAVTDGGETDPENP